MDNNSYKISLGVELDVGDIQSQINTASKKVDPITIKIDAETKELTKTINEALKTLSSGTKNVLTIDTTKLENSLGEVKDVVLEIKNAFGSLGDKSGMQSLLSSVNQIATSIGKVTDETETLVKSLNNLSKKDFSVNIGVKLGGGNTPTNNAEFGSYVRQKVFPELHNQERALIDYLSKYYNTGEINVLNKLAGDSLGGVKGIIETLERLEKPIKKGDNLTLRMEEFQNFFNAIKKGADIHGVDLSPVISTFTEDADTLVKTANDIRSGANVAKDSMNSLKDAFGVEGFSAQLDSIVKDLNEIKIAIQGLSSGISLEGLTQSFDRLSEVLEQLVTNATLVKNTLGDNLSNSTSNTGIEQTIQGEKELAQTSIETTNTVVQNEEKKQQAFKETVNEAKKLDDVSIDISDGNVDGLKNALKDLRIDDASIENVTKELNKLNIVAKNVSGTFKDGKLVKLDIKGVQTMEDGLERLVTITKTLGAEGGQSSEKYSQSFDKVAAEADKIKNKLKDTGFDGFKAEMSRAHTEADKFKESSVGLQEALKLLDAAMENINYANEVGDAQALVNANKEYENALKQVYSQLKLLKQAEKDSLDEESLTKAKANALLRLRNLFEDNSEAAKRFGSELKELAKRIDECDDDKSLRNIKKDIENLALRVKGANVETQTFGSKLKKQWEQYKSYLSVASLFMYAEQALRSMFDQVVAIDSAMTELKKVTDETASSYDKFLTDAGSKAREIGTTIDGLVSSTADFARLGYGFEESQGLAEVANIYAVVGDEIDSVETATQSLISTLTAFKNEANGLSDTDFALSIVDKMNEVSNNFAISSGGIGEALQRSASSMMAANNSLDETIALITAANTVVQDPDTVGTAFKTMSMRIRGAKTELEEAGLETEGMASSTAKLREEILALSGVDIMLNNNEFKSTYQIMEELADKWKNLTDIQQASVTELIAGKRQGNIVSSLMNNFDIAEQALETSLNSAGSAMKEHEKWQQSLEAQILKLKASWQSLSQAFLSSDFLKSALDAVINLVDGFTKLIDTIGTVPTLMLSFGAIKGLPKLLGNLFKNSLGKNSTFVQLAKELFDIDLVANKSNKSMKSLMSSLLGVDNAAGGAGGAIKKMASGLGGLITSHPYITAAVVAVTALTAAFTYQKKKAEDLAKEVEKVTSSYKEQHNELIKLKNNYDTSNESSMISKYEKLSKGVDGLGRNISLTTDEYSEYQSIVNTIAEQIPSLVSGYDEQGNALLSCKGNVEQLTEAYEKLIHAQNQDILTNTGNIEKDFENTLKDAEKGSFLGIGKKISTPSIELLEKVLNGDYSAKEIETLLKDLSAGQEDGVYEALYNAGIGDMGRVYSTTEVAETLAKQLKTDKSKIKGIVDDYYSQFSDAVGEQKTIAQAKLSEAFDISSAISGLNYGNIGEDLQAVAYQVVNGLDYDFFSKLSESGKSVEQWTTEMLNQLNAISKVDNAEIEAAFDLQTQFNGGEISYGEYVRSLKNVEETIDGLNLKSEAKEQIKISLGLDDEGVIEQYNVLVKRLTDPKNYDFDITESEAKKLLDGLSSEELAIAVDVITEMSNNNVNETIDEVRNAIDRELAIKGLSLDLSIDVEKTKIEALSTAITESLSGSGLSSESISAVEGVFSGLSSYDPSKLFERTANGIRLNSDEYRKLNSEYKKTNIAKVNKQMDSLGDIYNQTREELYRLTYGTDEYNAKASELSGIEEQIKNLEQLAAGYEGLTSAYQEWQMTESAGSQRDMYESMIEGLENIDDEIKRGWYDDGTIEFLELLTGRDLSTAGIDKVKSAYKSLGKEIGKTGYTVRDFFTVNEDGDSTNTGVYNFLDAINKLEKSKFGGKNVVQKNKKGNIIGFDFQIVGGDEVIAEALGISEELVQIMVRAADDAGFVVSMDGTYQQLDVLKEKAQEAAISLNNTLGKSGKKGFDFNFNATDVEDIKKQLTEAQKILDTFRNTDGTINTKLEGAEEALTVASTLQSMLDKLTRPTYMEIETSQVEDEIQEPLKNLQELRRLLETEHQLKLSGADTSQLEESKNEVYEYFENLDPEIKTTIGLVDDKGSPLTGDALKDKLNSGDIAIEATVDIQMEMDEKLGVLVDKALLDAGIIDKKEFEKRVKIYLNADVDNEDAKNKTEQAVNEVSGKNSGKSSSKNSKSSDNNVEKNVNVEVKADEVDTSDVKDKTEKAVKDESKEKLAVETTVELETTIEEATELIQKFEDKDITIDVKVKGLDDVKELNQNIDLATKIKGSVDKLSEYVEGAKALSELDDNIVSFVTAEVKGNVTALPEYQINNLKVFADSAKDIKNVGSSTSKVTADVFGNVKDTPESAINNLKVFSDSAKDLDDIGIVESSVTANINGNVKDTPEFSINNLKVFTDSAKDIESIGEDVKAKITADIKGNVKDTPEFSINNLKVFAESAKDIDNIGEDVKAKITADIAGNVKDEFEYKIDNLKAFVDNAKDVDSIGEDVKAKVTADVDGNVIDTPEGFINNIKTFTDSAKDIESVGEDVKAKVTADIDGNVIGTFESSINNLKVFTDSVKDIKSVGEDTKAKVTANIEGNVIDTREYKIDNLKAFTDSAKDVKNIGDVESKVVADVEGNVIDTREYKIDNLKAFTNSAKDVKSIGTVESKVTADVSGNVIDTREYKIDNLKVYTDSAKKVKDIGKVTSSVKADVDGNVIDTKEYKIDNLKVYTDSAKKVKDIGKVTSSVTADVDGNVIDTREGKIDNLKVFGESAKKVKDIGTVNSSVTANVNGNVIYTAEGKIDNLGVFADNANKLKGTGNFTSSVAANVSGNVITDDTVVTDLEHFASIVNGMTNQTVTVSVTANVDSANINNAINLLTKVSSSGVFKDYKATVQVGATIATIDDTVVQNYNAPKKEGKVSYSVSEDSPVYTWTAPSKDGVVNYDAKVEALTDAQKNKTGTITYKAKTSGFPVASGTAHANGSASGRAFARGNWGIKGNGVALGGELGRELVVRDGQFFTIGDNGAEFFRYKKNDIVFNAAQTESLFKYGGIKGANPRGKIFASGSAFVGGSRAEGGGAGKVSGNSITGRSYGNSSDSDKFEEVIDWIEILIDRIERAIDRFEQQANNIFKSWSSRNNALLDEISKVGEEIGIQQQAYDKYMEAANGVGLSEKWAKKVRDGTIDISTITDETLAEKIKDYQEWYEKALECQDAIEELKEKESELYKQRFDNVASQYDGILGVIEHEKNMLEEYINQSETQAWLVSANYYNALADNERDNVAQLKKEKAAMLAELQTVMESGTITKGSEAWYEMVASIDEVTLSITESETKLLEYQQTLQQLDWERFDLLQDKISAITEESEFLIDLLSSEKLYDDNGQLTNSGMATMGQHGVAYNVNMAQADKYGAEAEKLKKQLEKDPYDTELEERYREMISLQQEHILAAQDEKEAIRDMVEEGIELELDALQERIDKYNEALDSQKDLYDYQKKVKEQTEEIASLEKQMAAYAGDTSEETKAKVQELKVSLEEAKADLQESEYDKYISDQQQLLDELYLEYEEVLNARLDNIDALVSDMITEINTNASTISATLSEKAESVGYSLSDSMTTIWDTNSTKINSVITTYGEKFSTAQTTTNNALSTINTNLQNMITQLNKIAKTNVKSASISSAANSKEANVEKKPVETPKKEETKTDTTVTKTIKVGGKINAGSAKIYDYAGDKSGESQYYKKDPIYTVLAEKNSYLKVRYHKLKSGTTGWFKKSDVKAYATGKKDFLDDEIAWTQEKGREFIVRPSDGAILTPVAKGDSVLNAHASNNIWDMANSPADFIRDNLNLGSNNVPNNSSVQNSYTQNLDKIVFNLPNVKNYDELLSAMQKDKNFEKLILSMSIDKLAGKSSLAKNKSIR